MGDNVKQAHLFYACDSDNGDCPNESPPEATWGAARKTAKADGWELRRDGVHLCPTHAYEPVNVSDFDKANNNREDDA